MTSVQSIFSAVQHAVKSKKYSEKYILNIINSFLGSIYQF